MAAAGAAVDETEMEVMLPAGDSAPTTALPDSEPHVVKYMGRLRVRASPDNPPDGAMCSSALRTL